MTKSATVKTFDEFKKAFAATFTYKRTRSEKLKTMMARTQVPRENLQDYILDKLWLCEGLDFSVSEIRDEIASGLWSRDLAHYMLGHEYDSTDSILQDIVRLEKIQEGRRERVSEQRDRRVAHKDSSAARTSSGRTLHQCHGAAEQPEQAARR